MVLEAQNQVAQIHLSEAVLDYLQALIAATRNHPALEQGLSPRGALALAHASKAAAWLAGRDYASHDNVQTVWTAVAAHRISLKATAHASDSAICRAILHATPLG
jgi:MoxR-like ATPase